jgi:uncharacterized RDD family membrane protein YckC
MNCPKCGEVCSCPMEPLPSESSTADQVSSALPVSDPDFAEAGEPEGGAWRDELAARLNRYRTRRKAPPPRYPSLRLPFDAAGPQARASASASASLIFEPASNHALALDGRQQEAPAVEEPSPTAAPPEIPSKSDPPKVSRSVAQAKAKIIEFPRFAWGPPAPPPDQLAEPVMDRPRILDVPDIEAPLPALGGITIEPAQVAEVEKRPGIDIPLQTAPLASRVLAFLVDGLVVGAAAALFGFIFWKVAEVPPPQIQMVGAIAGMLCLFWVAYQYLLIVHAANTPGLRLAGLQLTKFDGSSTTRSLRRLRVLASCLSAFSLGMGYAWVFLDEDSLCWHDRITRTYLAPRSSSPC